VPPSSHAYLGFALALVIALLATPIARTLAWRIGAIDEPRERGLHQFPTPRLGGLAILLAVIVAGIVFMPHNRQTEGILIGAGVIALVGAADDLLELNAEFKLLGQTLAAVVPVAAGVRVSHTDLPFMGVYHFSTPVSYVLTVVGTVALMNIVNFIDGVDGLAAGVCTIASLTFAAILLSIDRTYTAEAGILAMITAGSSLGYLRHGFAPASIFLGDSGSNLLGYLLAMITVQGALKTIALTALAFPLVILAVPILDSSFVIAKRIKYGRPIYKADRWHFHHRFANIGFSPRRTILYLYGWTLSLAALALALRFVPYSDHHGHFNARWMVVLGLFGLLAVIASVYLVLVLEILKLRRFRHRQMRRESQVHGKPPPSPAEVDARLARELETGEYDAVDIEKAQRERR